MTSIASPNGLAIVGALFMLSGLAILGSALLARTSVGPVANSSIDSTAKLNVAAWFGLPAIALGLFLQAAGNMVATPIGSGLTIMLLALAFAMLLFVMMDETLADVFAQRSGTSLAPSTAQLALPAPVETLPDGATGAPEQQGLALAS